MDKVKLDYKERLRHFGWLRWVAGINVVIMVVDQVKTKRCNRLHTKHASNGLKLHSNRLNWPLILPKTKS